MPDNGRTANLENAVASLERDNTELKHRVGDLEQLAHQSGEALSHMRDVVQALQSAIGQLELSINRAELALDRLKRNAGLV